MKKIALLCGIALCFGLTACDDMLPNPDPQSNPQLATFDSKNLVIAQDASTVSEPINLQSLADQGLRVSLADITTLTDFPETYNLVFKVDLATSEDFADFTTVTATANDENVITVPSASLNAAIYDNFTHDPNPLTVYARFAAYAQQGTSEMRLGGKDTFFGTYKYEVIPFNPAVAIDRGGYYLIGSFCDWKVSGAIPFTQAVAGSVYDNPNFIIKIDVTEAQAAAGFEWKVVPAASIGDGNTNGMFGVEPSAAGNTGALVLAEGTENAGKITSAMPYTITINMETLTYSVDLAFDYLWVPGQGSSTSNFSKVLQLYTKNYVDYQGVVRLRNSWYLTGQASNTGVVFKTPELTDADAKGIYSGKLVSTADDPEAVNMNCPNGLYYIQANLVQLTYKASPIKSIQIIGELNGWDTATAADLTHASNFLTWTINGVEIAGGSEFKFCVDHDWALSFGGKFDNIEQNAGNLVCPETGKYDITLDFSALPYTVKMVKK